MDDPWFTVTGSLAQRNKSIAIVILFWRALGISSQLKKGQHGTGDKHQARDLE